MSQNDGTQRLREQDERRLSVQRNNAYVSFKATEIYTLVEKIFSLPHFLLNS